jgi:hypothetical protein
VMGLLHLLQRKPMESSSTAGVVGVGVFSISG